MEKLIYDDIREYPNQPTTLECVEDDPPTHKKYLRIWTYLLNVYIYMGIPNPTKEESEWGARMCELYCEDFPILFPDTMMTPKNAHLVLCPSKTD